MRTDHSSGCGLRCTHQLPPRGEPVLVLPPEFRHPDGLVASRSHAPFPSPLARFRSTVRSALRAMSTTESPQGGNPK